MQKDQSLKEQRDRFLAFAFASADLFLEVSDEGRVVFALGAAKGMTGVDEKTMIGKNWLELFSAYDQALVLTTYERAKPGQRAGPLLVNLSETMGTKPAIMTGIKMPGSNTFYITLGVGNPMMNKFAEMINPPVSPEVLTRENFSEAVKDALYHAKSIGENVKLTLFDLPPEAYKKAMGAEGWSDFQSAVGEVLTKESYDGYTAGMISEGRYSVLHSDKLNADFLRDKIADLAKQRAPSNQDIKIESKTIEGDLNEINERDAARAVFYTIHEFERKGTDITIETLNSGFNDYLNANTQKMKEFKNFISSSSFSIFFQPIVSLETMEANHYEMLCRFTHGDTMEWIMFGEDIGMAAEFDIAMCERAVNFIKFKGGVTHTKFSLNLSGQSIEDEAFFNKLMALLNKHSGIANRLMFEITESSQIRDLKKVSTFVGELRRHNFKIALDDFGAGAASFRYLQKLDVDYIKLDGKYTRKLLTSQRDVAMVKNLVQMSHDLGMKVIAEFVEDPAQLSILKDMGVEYGQGYLFGKPAPAPNYVKDKK